MENNCRASLEKALAKTEADVDATLKVAASVVNSLKKVRVSLLAGDLREVKRTLESADQAIAAVKQQFINTKEGWSFDSESYVASRAFAEEILEMAKSLGVQMFERDEMLYCYPSLIRILPEKLAVQIDKKIEKLLRPSTLVNRLKALQDRPVRFKAEAFLESLFSAYEILIRSREEDQIDKGIVIPLLEIYRLLTLFPGQARDYSRQEFGRDLYLLDESGVKRTKSGLLLTIHKEDRRRVATIPVITKEGQAIRYYGISFTAD